MLSKITEIYIVLLILFAGVYGILMLAISNHARRHPENREASTKWMDTIQNEFWSGLAAFVFFGAGLLSIAMHNWF